MFDDEPYSYDTDGWMALRALVLPGGDGVG